MAINKKNKRKKTTVKEAIKELKEAGYGIRVILNSTFDGIYATDKNGKILIFNDSFLSLWKIPKKIASDELNKEIPDIINNKVKDQEKYLKKIGELYILDEDSKDIIVLKDGRYFERLSSPLKQDDSIIGRVWVFRDITEQKKADEKIWYLTFHDKLTGLYNHAFFKEELKRLNTKRRLPLSIIFCDLNRLKEINNNFGYERGDLLLRKFAQILRSCFRNEDVVVRWGGDVFVMILPDTDKADIENVIKRIQKKCEKNSKGNMPLSISIGFATKSNLLQNINLIVNEAEKKMNLDKEAKKT